MGTIKHSQFTEAENLTDSKVVIVQGGINKIAPISLFALNLRATKTVTASEIRSCGASPVTIISAPGVNKFISVSKIVFSYKYVAPAFNFGVSDFLYFGCGLGNFSQIIDDNSINLSTSFNGNAFDGAILYQSVNRIDANEALIMSTGDGGNASQGGGNLDLVIYYTIEDVNI